MSSLLVGSPTRTSAIPDRDAADHADRQPKQSMWWALLQALAYAGAYIDPTGVLAAQRFAQMRELERYRDRR